MDPRGSACAAPHAGVAVRLVVVLFLLHCAAASHAARQAGRRGERGGQQPPLDSVTADVGSTILPALVCRPDAAWRQLVASSPTGPHAEVAKLVRCLPGNASQVLQAGARGRALLVPTNSDVARQLWAADFTKDPPTGCAEVGAAGEALLLAYLGRMAVDASRFRQELPLLGPCDLVATVSSLDAGGAAEPWANIMDRSVGNLDSYVRATRPGARPRGYAGHGVALGYKLFEGYPASTLPSGIDPGVFSARSPFALSGSLYLFEAATACTQTLSSSSTYSFSQYQKSLTTRVGVGAELAVVSFSANTEFSRMTRETREDNSLTIVQGTQVGLGSYRLRARSGLTLGDDFVAAVRAVAAATATGDNTLTYEACLSFYNTFGSHFITRVFVGAQQYMVLQMSASAQETLTRESISITASASITFGLWSKTVSTTTTKTTEDVNRVLESSSYKEATLSPELPAPPFTDPPPPPSTGGGGGGFKSYPQVACSNWTRALQASGNYSITGVQLADNVGLLAMPHLWAPHGVAVADLALAAKSLRRFVSGCGPDPGTGQATLGCQVVAPGCGMGTFSPTNDSDVCLSCYEAASFSGDRQPCPTTLGCHNITGECQPGPNGTEGQLRGVAYFGPASAVLHPMINQRPAFSFDPASSGTWNSSNSRAQNVAGLPSSDVCTCRPTGVPCTSNDLVARCSVVAGVSYADPSSASLIGTYDLDYGNSQNPQDCCDLCSKNSNCTYWVLAVSGDPEYCYLHQAGVPGDRFSVKSQSFVGTSRAKDDPLLLPNITYGSDTFLSSRPLNSSFEFPAQTCALACRDAPASSCGAWSFSESRRRCFFKSGGQAYSSSSGSWSGPRKPICTTGCEGDLGCGSNTAYVFSGYYVPAVQHDVRLKLQATESAAVWFGLNKGFSAANAIVTFTSTLPNGQLNTGSSQSQAFTLKAGVAYAVRVYWYVKQDGAFFSLVNTLTGDEFLSPKRSLARLVFYSSTADGF